MKILLDIYGDADKDEIIEALKDAFRSVNLSYKILWSEVSNDQ